MKKTKIFLDTDIGDDIDDALALFMLLNMEQCELVGISTVYANTMLRARLVKKMLQLAKRQDIPVYAGIRENTRQDVDINHKFNQYDDELMDDQLVPLNDSNTDGGKGAIKALIDAAIKYGNELVVLAIGPFTNIAEAVKQNIEAFKDVKIVLMGGCFYEQFIEYNVYCDPEAAHYLFKQDLNIHVIGADVTWKVQLNDEQTKAILDLKNDDISGYAAELVRRWKSHVWFNPVLHDPLAAFYAINSSVCKLEPVWVEVETKSDLTKGLTLNMDHNFKYLEHKMDRKRILCAYEVDSNLAIENFLKFTFNINKPIQR